MGKKVSGAQKRKKRKEKEKLALEMERLKLGPTAIWTGLVLHHKDIFVSHVLSKLNTTDRFFFKKVNGESWGVLEYAGLNVSEIGCTVYECLSISTLELVWNNFPWGPSLCRLVDKCRRAATLQACSCVRPAGS